MKNSFLKTYCLVIALAAASLPLLASTAAAQDRRLEQRIANEKNLRDNERLRRGMEADSEVRAKSKEERQKIVNEAFMRLQILHNETMEVVLSSAAPDLKRVSTAVEETKQRAIELRANLVLPKPPKDEKPEKTEETAAGKDLKQSLTDMCALIRSFVTNLNNSPTDNKAADQARRELDSLVSLSDKITRDLAEAGKRVN
jgi:hypothetical protein